MGAWAIWAAPLIMGNDVRSNDVRSLTAEQRTILLNTEVIAVDQDPAGAAGTPVLLKMLPRVTVTVLFTTRAVLKSRFPALCPLHS